MQQLKDCDKLSSLAYPQPLPNMQAVMSDSNVREYLSELQNNGCKLICLLEFLFVISQFLSFLLHRRPHAVFANIS